MKKKYLIIIISVLVVAVIVAFGQVFTVRDINVVFYNKTGLAGEAEILEASGLSYRKNIFSVKENDIKKNVLASFDDNSIIVTNVERKFPDEIVLYVKERTPIFKMKVYRYDDRGGFVAPDKDFQRVRVYEEDELNDIKLIPVKGYQVRDSFDVKECIALREVVYSLISKGMSEESLPYFIEKIEYVVVPFSSSDVVYLDITLSETQAVLRVSMENAGEDMSKLYEKYISLDINSRYNAQLR